MTENKHEAPQSPASSNYYFVHRRTRSNSTEVNFDTLLPPSSAPKTHGRMPSGLLAGIESDGGVLNRPPAGATSDGAEFFSRRVIKNRDPKQYVQPLDFKKVIPAKVRDPPIASRLLPRKVPVKVEPKVYFAAERTFLTWLHSTVWLFVASLTILAAYGINNSNVYVLYYGITIFPVAVAFAVYALTQFHSRIRMIKDKLPGPYEDIVGPCIMGVLLMIAIVAQFSLILYSVY